MNEQTPHALAGGMKPATSELVLGMPLYVGLGIIFLFFCTFFGWAVFSPLESAAIAPGEVYVDTKRKTIQHLEGGIISKIMVRDGDLVEPGQVLIHLDQIQPLANLALIQGRFNAARALEYRLRAERDQLKKVVFPQELEKRRSSDPEVMDMLETQERIFRSRRKSIAGQRAILNQRIVQYKEEINGLSGQIEAQDEHVAISNQEIKALKDLVTKGLSGNQRMLELKRDLTEIKGERAKNISSIARVGQKIVETKLEIVNLDTAQMNEVVQELREVKTELYDQREKIRAVGDVLKRTDIIAPIAGTVVGLNVHTVGGVITRGEELMDIVPAGEQLIIEARVNPNDIDVVKLDLPAHVRFTAFNQRDTNPVEGKVVTISADRLSDERTGEVFYSVRIELIGDLQEALDGKALYPGMQAEVMILTGARTPLDYFIQPITQSFNRAFREQ
jgi:HlyD family type I secretion membrane fusion protein